MRLSEFLDGQLRDPQFATLWQQSAASFKAGDLILKARMGLALSQEELAARAGVKRSYIARLEGGEANPTVRTLARILAAVGYSLELDARSASESDQPRSTSRPKIAAR